MQIPPSGRVAFLRPEVPLRLTAPNPSAIPKNPATIGERLKKRRAELGLTQGQAAERLGISQSALCRWEKGLGEPGEEAQDRIARFLD